MNQASIILNHLMRHGELSNSTAKSRYGIQKLSARVKEMRYLGLQIEFKNKAYSLKGHKVPKRVRVIEEDDLFPDYI